MRTAEKVGRFFMTLCALTVLMFLVLPHTGISVDVILSGSMEPALHTGGIVFTDTRQKVLKEGDIATYQLREGRVSHRILKKTANGYVTKGDANKTEDPLDVEASQIIGKVVMTIPYLGFAAMFVKEKTVFALIAVMIIQELFFLLIQRQDCSRKENTAIKCVEHIYEKTKRSEEILK